MKRIFLVCLLACGCFFGATPDLRARLPKTPELVELFREVVAKPGQSTVRVLADGEEAALGTIVSADGWILSKYSELKGKKIVCRLPDGREMDADVFGFDVPFDLVMLKVNVKKLTPVVWTDSKEARIGHWVASVGTEEDPAAIGVLSVAARTVKGARFVAPTGKPGGYLGIAMDPDSTEGVKVQEVLHNTPASRAGIKANDLISAVNGVTVKNSDEFLGVLTRKKPGDAVSLMITRGDMELELQVTLGERPGSKNGKSRGEVQNNMGSKLSNRKAGFPVILQHDSVLKPTDCGGPLVNVDGKVLGINISRAGRTETYAIPSESVRPLLERLKTAKK